MVGIQEEILRLHSLGLLDGLLADRTTGGKILWATDAYEKLGPAYARDAEITVDLITGEHSGIIKNRARKELEQQNARTRSAAEVFTPMWICERMNDYLDEAWHSSLDTYDVDGREKVDAAKPKRKTWRDYVDATVLEITCGEAPFLVSRYDVSNGEGIPLKKRIGLLDRKLQTVNERAATENDWMKATLRAFQSSYGYELQGDNLLIARVNLLTTFEDNLKVRWERTPTDDEYKKIVDIIVWNIWQMDGLTGTIPGRDGETAGGDTQMSLFGLEESENQEKKPSFCKIRDWRKKGKTGIHEYRQREREIMKFDFIIGNPPYQDEVENNGRKNPIYNLFMDTAYKIGDIVELITPARFLFNAGQTPKDWNQKMLSDPHLKVLYYEQDSSKIFTNAIITGGIVITYRSTKEDFGPIGVFSSFKELNTIMEKVNCVNPLSDIIIGAVPYRFTDCLRNEHPECVDLIGKSFDLRTNVLDRLQGIVFFDDCPGDGFIKIIGLCNKKRAEKWIARKYIDVPENFEFYKVLLPKSNGSPAIGEAESTPLIGFPVIGQPLTGHTQTFISIGKFETEVEAKAALKYVKSKFARTMLGILKITQDNPSGVWRYVPLQNFTSSSDIDWSKSVSEIDAQLYKKYGLNDDEVAFIESHVKEMK